MLIEAQHKRYAFPHVERSNGPSCLVAFIEMVSLKARSVSSWFHLEHPFEEQFRTDKHKILLFSRIFGFVAFLEMVS